MNGVRINESVDSSEKENAMGKYFLVLNEYDYVRHGYLTASGNTFSQVASTSNDSPSSLTNRATDLYSDLYIFQRCSLTPVHLSTFPFSRLRLRTLTVSKSPPSLRNARRQSFLFPSASSI
jgi:hypothetical protein